MLRQLNMIMVRVDFEKPDGTAINKYLYWQPDDLLATTDVIRHPREPMPTV